MNNNIEILLQQAKNSAGKHHVFASCKQINKVLLSFCAEQCTGAGVQSLTLLATPMIFIKKVNDKSKTIDKI